LNKISDLNEINLEKKEYAEKDRNNQKRAGISVKKKKKN